MTNIIASIVGDGTSGNPYRPYFEDKYNVKTWVDTAGTYEDDGFVVCIPTTDAGTLASIQADPLTLVNRNWYVSPTGLSSNGGGKDFPKALNNISGPQPGDTVILLDGVYTGNYLINSPGSAGKMITYRPDHKYGAKINYLYIDGDYICVRDLVFNDPNFITRTTVDYSTSAPTGIPQGGVKINSRVGCKILNCYIHDTDEGIRGGTNSDGGEFSGNVIVNCGWDSNRGSGHGAYISNPFINRATIKNNITGFMFGFGLHGYAELSTVSPKKIINMDYLDNICFGAGELSRLSRSVNLYMGCSGLIRPENCTMQNNYIYSRDADGGICMGGGTYGSYECSVLNNYSLSGGNAMTITNPDALNMTGNTFVGSLSGFASGDYPTNTYLSQIPVSETVIGVMTNDYQTDRANVVIYNYTSADTVQVDLTAVAGLSIGDSVLVRNVQDYFVDVQTLTLDENKKIVINMQSSNRTVLVPQGWVAPATTFPVFGAFVVEKV